MVWLGARIDVPNESCYWQRVWVIQEFGKARKLEICWASTDIPWAYYHYGDRTSRSVSNTWEDFVNRYETQVHQVLHSVSSNNQNIRKFKKLR